MFSVLLDHLNRPEQYRLRNREANVRWITGLPVISSQMHLTGANEPADGPQRARKKIGPMKDSAIEWVSFESIEIVMALGSSGDSPKIFA